MQFLEELKRRNVIRVGAAYVVAAWLIIQVVETLFPIYDLPDAAVRFVVTALAVGLIPVILLAWALEVTPEGLKWEKNVDRSRSISGQTGKRLDRIIIAALAVAVGFFAFDKFVLSESREAEIAETAREEGRAEAHKARFEQSIAVLPFANRSNLEEDIYFVDGIHDDILTQLARINALAVTSRTSVEQYRGTTLAIKDIAGELDVRTILEGGVQRAGDRVRINVQLIDATNDDHLWAETYVRELTAANIFAVQADIASSVARALAATLMPDEESALAAIPTESMAAYDYYLLGRHHWRQRTKESIELARDYFLQAIEQDPDYVPALSGLADSYTLLTEYGTMRGDVAFPLAQETIDRAIALDDSNSEVWASQGILYQYMQQYGAADPALKKAIELDPKNSQAWTWYSTNLRISGRLTESFEAAKKAYELEPMSTPINNRMAWHYNGYADFARQRQHIERVAQGNEGLRARSAVRIAGTYSAGGDLARAIDGYRSALASDPSDIRALDGVARAYLALGDIREAERWFGEVVSQNPLYRGHKNLHYAREDFASVIALMEDLLQVNAPLRDDFWIVDLFRAHYEVGDIEEARTYLAELLDIFQGRYEVRYWQFNQLEGLAIASFWINFGDEASGEPQRGFELAKQIRDNHAGLYAQGLRHPTLLTSLAVAEGMLGNATAAFGYLDEAVDHGYRDNRFEFNQRAFDSLREDPRFAEIEERISALVAQERSRLDTIELAPYTAPVTRQPVAVARETIERYLGYYTDGNTFVRLFTGPDGQFMGRLGQLPPGPMLMASGVEFYSSAFPNQTGEFFSNDDGVITHFLWKSGTNNTMFKRVPDPPPAVQLSRDSLARFEGVYASDRLGGLKAERTDADTWVAEIYVDDDGTPWVDFDDQPKLELAAISESALRIIGFEGRFEFEFGPEGGAAIGFVMTGDAGNVVFVRQQD